MGAGIVGVVTSPFDKEWAKKESEGYQFGEDEIEKVRFGWEMRERAFTSSDLSIPMLLYCPMCGMRHIDRGVFATKAHHTHACQTCGHVWRPAIIATVGVEFLPGFKDALDTPAPTGKDGSHE